jgi:hypothetical protein
MHPIDAEAGAMSSFSKKKQRKQKKSSYEASGNLPRPLPSGPNMDIHTHGV